METTQKPEREAVYSPDEAAKILGVHRNTIMRWIRDETLYAAKLGGRYRISQSEIDRLTSIGIKK